MSKLFKCPFCLYSFEEKDAIPVNHEGGDIITYKCPNPREKNNRPFCDKELPLNYFEAESTVISIAGGRNVGKTYFLIALFLQVTRNRGFQKLGFSGILVGHSSAINKMNEYIEIIKSGNKLDFSLMHQEIEEQAI